MVLSAEHLRILSRPDWVEPIVALLRKQFLGVRPSEEHLADRSVIALTEAITNAIVHGNLGLSSLLKERENAFGQLLEQRSHDPDYFGRIVDIRFEGSEDADTWIIVDQGAGFDVDAALRKSQEETSGDDELASGRGITLIKAFVDHVEWSNGGRQIKMTLVRSERTRDRRISQRIPCLKSITFRTLGGAVRKAIVRDLSDTGIGFVATESLKLGCSVEVTINEGRSDAIRVVGTVVRSRHLTSGFCDIAVRFDRPLVSQEVSVDVDPGIPCQQ